jgi:DNA repair protein RecN (Recombination protein N)
MEDLESLLLKPTITRECMLKQLLITNLILIETTEISFETGLNVLSGETGSGKSAIMEALSLIIGQRADAGMIRKGSQKGVVEAIFDIEAIPLAVSLLEQAGIDHSSDEELIIRREVFTNGKSRAFINNQMAQLSFLKTLGELLVEIVGQHANQLLLTTENHRSIVDLFYDLGPTIAEFGKSWEAEIALRKNLEELVNNESKKLREIEICKMELEDLHGAYVKENEEEELFAEYTILANGEQLAQNINEINQVLTGEKISVIALLGKQKSNFEQLLRIDPSLAETAKSFENSLLELQEVSYTLLGYQTRHEHHPERINEVNERLGIINRLKRKYGPTVAEIAAYQKKIEEKLLSLENSDQMIDDLKNNLKCLEDRNNSLAKKLSEERLNSAQFLEKAIVKQLRALNMPKVEFQIDISAQKRNRCGDDKIEFFLIPNVGEHKVPIKECASGGELSRLMLAIQTLLAGKKHTPTLIFDEIDANIGGETAAVVGEKLLEIGDSHQILCITHFPQVARQAKHHLQISKKELDGRTVSVVRALDSENRQIELKRMLGEKAEVF